MNPSKRLWRESASLLIVGRNVITENERTNFKILVMKRSSESSFMPNATVFPGGAYEASDENPKWLEYYRDLGISNHKFDELLNVKGPRPSIFQRSSLQSMAKEISLRICAIRETFEEVGLLICKTPEEFARNDIFSKAVTKFNVKNWQTEVHNNPSKFLDLCKSLNVAPDLWSLYEWSAWLTPIFMPKRFKTAFYYVALNNQPEIVGEQFEVQESSWESSEKLMESYKLRQISITGPQVYELMRLYPITDINRLTEFARERSSKGVQLFFPVIYPTDNATVSILPGDDFYPMNLDFENEPIDAKSYYNEKVDEFRRRVKNIHRSEYHDRLGLIFISNIEPANGHLPLYQIQVQSKM